MQSAPLQALFSIEVLIFHDPASPPGRCPSDRHDALLPQPIVPDMHLSQHHGSGFNKLSRIRGGLESFLRSHGFLCLLMPLLNA